MTESRLNLNQRVPKANLWLLLWQSMKLGIHAAAVAFGCPEVASECPELALELVQEIFEFFDLFFHAERNNDEKVLLLEEIKNK